MLDRDQLIKYALKVKDEAAPFDEIGQFGHPDDVQSGRERFSCMQLSGIGRFIKELGEDNEDYELLGIGQSMMEHADKISPDY